MECTMAGCSGAYEGRFIVHSVRHNGRVVVIDHVPAEVCAVCGDVLLSPAVVRHIESILQSHDAPAELVPLYEYAETA